MLAPKIYRTKDSILNFFNNYNCDHQIQTQIRSLTGEYERALEEFTQNSKNFAGQKNGRLIVLEGLDGCGKSRISRELYRKIGAIRSSTPPDCMRQYRQTFDSCKELSAAYYGIGNYIAALEVSKHLFQSRTVIMDRFWHSTCAFGTAQAVHDFPDKIQLPPKSDTFYSWPEDLLKPDFVFFLNVDEDVRMQRLSRRTQSTSQEELLKILGSFRNNVIQAYRNMFDPSVIFIDGNKTAGQVTRNIMDIIKPYLQK